MLQIPDSLWAHRLFRGSARHVPAVSRPAVARCESRLRRLRNMPSTADETPDALTAGTMELFRVARRWVETARGPDVARLLATLRHIEGVCALCAGGAPPGLWPRRLERLRAGIPPGLRDRVPDSAGSGDELRLSLGVLSLLVLDDALGAAEGLLCRRYLKRAYRTADRALAYNATSDPRRLRPVLNWIRARLEAEGRRGCSYLESGCGMAAGAPGAVLAADILRPGGVVREVHGADIVPPPPGFARDMLRRNGVWLYACDPVRRPPVRRYDAILLANVHRHLDPPAQARLLGHLLAALAPGGRLFVNWRFNDAESPCLCLGAAGNAIAIDAERNCV